MSKARLAGLLFCIVFFSGTAAAAGGNITGLVGFRQVDENQWAPNDTQGMLGVLGDFSMWEFPLHVEFGLTGSEDDGDFFDDGFVDSELRIGQFSAGFVLIPDYGPMRPYFALGVAVVNVEAEVDDNQGRFSDEDTSTGAYIGGGMLWRLRPNFDIGFDARYLGGTDVDLRLRSAEQDLDVDGFTVGFRIGYGWDFHPYDYERERRPPPPRRPRRY